MQMLYNSDSYVVVQFDDAGGQDGLGGASGAGGPNHWRGGFDIVDKFARKEIYLEGALAERFRQGVADLAEQNPEGMSPETLDDYIATFTELAPHPLVQH
jgi:hypothetical protein